jgi:2,4-dienoyl-CoA reductase-like NADH-dependent reductase (Old Yellow Enzyme family)/thioredoxin reductase
MPGEDTTPQHKDFGIAPGADKSAQADGGPQQSPSSYTKEYLQAMIEDYAQQAKDLKALGFDMVSVYCCYRNNPMAKLLSPITNDRDDEYGAQSLENRGRYLVEMFTALRKAVGRGFPLECVLSVDEEEFGGYTKEDTIQVAKLMEGVCDIFHLRSGDMDPQHPLGFTSTEDKPAPYIDAMRYVCKEIKSRGINMVVAASAGFQDPEIANDLVAEGGADLIYMARSWINNPDYGKNVYTGHKENIVPCIRCNKCHVPNGPDLFRTVCSVNPILGMEDRIGRMIQPATEKRKVAVVGGGPAGMEFARVCAQRGHDVTLYEATESLGGMLRHANYPSFKWPLRQFMEYMIKEMDRLGINVKLNTKATKEILAAENYEVLALALGAEPSSLPLPGKDGANVAYAANIYGHEDTLGKNVTIIGGGEIGVETGLYLAELGHRVTVLEMQYDLILDAPHAHYRNMVVNYWRHCENFAYQAGVTCTAIEPDGVCYNDPDGKPQKQQADNVLLAIGMKSKQDEAMELASAVPYSVVIGDCDKPGNVQKCMRSAFGTASQI